eukprot:3555381-Amphidinium_carterae.2
MAPMLGHLVVLALQVSRSLEAGDETASIFYDSQQLELLGHETRWLAPAGTPNAVPGWDAAFPRTLEIATFCPTGKDVSMKCKSLESCQLRVLNTHFDHVGSQARQNSGNIIAEVLSAAEPGQLQLLCGDFNSPKVSNAVYSLLQERALGLNDAATSSKCRPAMHPCTIHKFQGLDFTSDTGDGTVDLSVSPTANRPDARHIDWILWRNASTACLQPVNFEVITDTLPSDMYPSDHFPVSFEFDLVQRQAQ